ncbi:MAG: hypothetical protein WCK67_12150 [bacterium]
MITSFGKIQLTPQTIKIDEPKKNDTKIVTNTSNAPKTAATTIVDQPDKDVVEINTAKTEAKQVKVPENKTETTEEKPSEIKETPKETKHEPIEENKTENVKSKLSGIMKFLPQKDEKISSKSILLASTAASGVAVLVGLLNKKVFETIAIIGAFFTPYLLTKGAEMIKDQHTPKKTDET